VAPPSIEQALSLRGSGREWTLLANGDRGSLMDRIAALGGSVMQEQPPSLDEIFVARACGQKSVN